MGSRSLPVRVVERARIVLLAAGDRQDKQIAHAIKITPKKVSRWRSRFLTLGLAGLERDASGPGRTPKINASLARRVVRMTTQQKPPNATHWSTRSMARAVGISEASVRRIWRRHGRDIVGLYRNPPEHALECCAWMRKARSKLWIVPNRACR